MRELSEAPRAARPRLEGIELRGARPEDGAAIHALVARCGTLELNSPYAYVLLADHFGATSVVAFVVNVEPAGDSRRPSVCFGSTAEAGDCAGSGGGGGSGCGCTLDAPAAGRPPLGMAILLVSLVAAISRARVARR